MAGSKDDRTVPLRSGLPKNIRARGEAAYPGDPDYLAALSCDDLSAEPTAFWQRDEDGAGKGTK